MLTSTCIAKGSCKACVTARFTRFTKQQQYRAQYGGCLQIYRAALALAEHCLPSSHKTAELFREIAQHRLRGRSLHNIVLIHRNSTSKQLGLLVGRRLGAPTKIMRLASQSTRVWKSSRAAVVAASKHTYSMKKSTRNTSPECHVMRTRRSQKLSAWLPASLVGG